MIQAVVGFDGPIEWDSSKPDGTPRKWVDMGRLQALGWQAKTPLEQGLGQAYADFLARYEV